jgi:hypothetical protein
LEGIFGDGAMDYGLILGKISGSSTKQATKRYLLIWIVDPLSDGWKSKRK